MDIRIVTGMLAVLALVAAVAFAATSLRENGAEEDAPSPILRHPGGEPAASELARCRGLGKAATEDDACRKAWDENRRRFLGTDGERPRP